MIPRAFEYHAPTSIGEAIGLLDRHGDEARMLAGGHSLLQVRLGVTHMDMPHNAFRVRQQCHALGMDRR